jgi:4-aminobutyrate aminotransferase
MIATEFTGANGLPDAETTAAVQRACLERNLLLLSCGSYKNVIRWIPPLIVTRNQIDEALAVFNDALNEVR